MCPKTEKRKDNSGKAREAWKGLRDITGWKSKSFASGLDTIDIAGDLNKLYARFDGDDSAKLLNDLKTSLKSDSNTEETRLEICE